MRHVPARYLVLALTSVALLFAASPALAAFSVSNVTATPTPTSAGAPADLAISTTFAGAGGAANETVQSLTTHMGPGILGNPLFDFNNVAGQRGFCAELQFQADACPPNTQIGTTSIALVLASDDSTPAGAPIPGTLYNLAPDHTNPTQADAVAVIGVHAGTIRQHVVAKLSPLDGGLDSTTIEPFPTIPGVHVKNVTLTLTSNFLTNPTACIPVAVGTTATGHDGVTSSGTSGYTPTDCDTEPFSSTLDTNLDTTRTDTPVALGVTVHVPATPTTPQRNANVFRSTVVLPKGVTINPALGTILDKCTDEQFAATDLRTAAACPAAAQIATVTFISPVFPTPISGPVYYGSPGPGELNRLFVDVPLPGLHLKLTGHTTANPVDGQITNVFDQQPQLPFTSFNLTFNGGPHSVFSTPTTCGVNTATSDQVPWSAVPLFPASAHSTPSANFTTSYDGAGAACVTSFKPTLATSVTNPKSGGSGTFTLSFDRPDRDTHIAKAAFALPKGLVANLALKGLTQCPLATAAAANCPASSHVGTASVKVGVGPEPATLPGQVFLAAPKVKGDPASLSVLVPATLGPVDLGKIVVGVRLQLRADGSLLNTTDALPQFQGGVPATIRTATVTLDRAGFMRYPSSCGTQTSGGTFTGVDNASASASGSFSLSDCAKLKFAPKLAVKLNAKRATSSGKRPSISTVLTQRKGEAAPKTVKVVLPSALSTNLKALNNACSLAAYNAGKCGSKAKAGSASATSPLLTKKLSGTAYFVKQAKTGTLPNLVVQLRGPLSIDVTGKLSVAKNGQLTTTFNTPDVPITRFALSLRGGKAGVLINNRSLCKKTLVTKVGYRGQNGKKASQRAKTSVVGCPKPKKKHHKK